MPRTTPKTLPVPLRATTDNLWSAACCVMDDVLDTVRADEKPGNIGRTAARKAIKDAYRRVRCTVDDLDYIIFLAGEIADLEMSKHESARDWLINARDGKKAARFRKRVRAWVRRRELLRHAVRLRD